MKIKNKGDLLFKGISKNSKLNSIPKQKRRIIIEFSLSIYSIFLISYFLLNNIYLFLIIFFVFLEIFLILDIYLTPISIYGIYSEGISSAEHSILDYINNRTFYYYKNIEKIKLSKIEKNGKMQRVVNIFSNKNKSSLLTFNERFIKNNFIERLINILKEKRPDLKFE